MKVVVETNFSVGGTILEKDTQLTVDLSPQHFSLRDLLERLAKEHYEGRIAFIEPDTGQVNTTDYTIMINGATWEFLPERLETKLNKGDKVSITKWLEILGGG